MDSVTPNILSVLIWLPVVGGILILSTGGDRNAQLARKMALGFSVGTFLLSLSIYLDFDVTTSSMQFVERYKWIDAFHIQYFLGVDGISVPLIVLTALLTIIVVIAGWEVITKRVAQYMASFMIMEGLMIGVFSSMDAILFYLFWEAMLIPMFLIIGIWGGSNRVYAAIKFFLYTLLGSLLMLVAIVYLYFSSGHTFSIESFH
jgi:NADH-quinone oxidoreductase subunit M